MMAAHAQVITTVAGTDGLLAGAFPALDAPLGRSEGIAVDGAGNVYTAAITHNVVVKISPEGTLKVVAGNGTYGFSGDGGPATSAALRSPSGVAVDFAGNLYIADNLNSRVRMVSNGIITTVAGNGTYGFSGDGGPATSAALRTPDGVAVDPVGNLYIADSNTQRIRKVSNGIITTVAGNGTQGFSGDDGPATGAALSYPTDVAVDSMGNFYITDRSNQRVRKVSNGIITTVAGNGAADFSGDGGPATSAALNPNGVSLDSAGNIYVADASNHRIRKVSNGIIATVAGNGAQRFSGDGGAATNASLAFPSGVAVDSTGNLYIADYLNYRIRKVSNGIITTLAGNGESGNLGDGGPATSAELNSPYGVAVDSAGRLYIMDSLNQRIRKVSNGIITTVAGNGARGSSGDDGPATNARLNSSWGLAVDSADNLYVADRENHRIRKVSGGTITTVAGNGVRDFSGDGGPATSAALNFPAGVAVDSAGNLYIADTQNNRVRKVSNGIITTVAGNGTNGFSGAVGPAVGDGGPATEAPVGSPYGVAVDSSGNLYIAQGDRIRKVSDGIITTVAGGGTVSPGDGGPAVSARLFLTFGVAVDSSDNLYFADRADNRIRRVSNGVITTVAGNGTAGFSGDGGPASSASLYFPAGVALDRSGNLYIADLINERVRAVLASAPSFQISSPSLSFTATSGGVSPGARTVNLTSAVVGLSYSISSDANWLSATPSSGAIPVALRVSADPSHLTAGTYTGTLTIRAPDAFPTTQTVSVSFSVSPASADRLLLGAQSLPFTLTEGAGPAKTELTLSNEGSGAVRFTANADSDGWLQVSPGSGIVSPAAPVSLTVTAIPGSLGVGTYNGAVTVLSPDTAQQIIVPVNLAISAPPRKMLLSQTGLTFRAVAQGGVPLPQSFGVLNIGQRSMNWSADVITLSGGGWLSIDPAEGVVATPFTDVSFVNVTIDASRLEPGDFYGQIRVRADGAANSPQTVSVALTVLPRGTNPGVEVRPTGLIFTGAAGSTPGSQDVLLSNLTEQAVAYNSGVIGRGLKILPTDATVSPARPGTARVFSDFNGLAGGAVQQGTVTFQFTDFSPPRSVQVLLVVAPSGTPGEIRRSNMRRNTEGCVATTLYPVFTQLATGLTIPAGWPATVAARIVDDCGAPMISGSVLVSFSNGDAPIALVSLQNGTWSGTWQPRNPMPTVGLTLEVRTANLSKVVQSSVSLEGSKSVPVLSAGPLSAATMAEGPLSPGELLLIKGSGLADRQESVGSARDELGGASIAMGGRLAPLLYADTTRLLGLVPPDAPVNTALQLLVRRGQSLGIPVPVIISATHPAILTTDESGWGQGLIYKANAKTTTLADASNPAQPGDTVLIYATGLGATDAQGSASHRVSVHIGGLPAQVNYAGIARPQDYPPSGAPMILGGLASASLGGLYEITAVVPSGLANGSATLLLSSGEQRSQAGVTLAITGGAAVSTPVITSINTAGGFRDIAQNDFIEIKGANLAPVSVGSGVTWDNAPEFALGQMPTQLGGVSVTVNGKAAFVYFVSPAQLNVLTPLGGTSGPAQVVVTHNGVSSAPLTVNMLTAAPSLLKFGATSYVVTTHADGSLLGPETLSVPGVAFTPARPGETIILYGVGFGQVASELVNGSSRQSGELPTRPMIQIDGAQADVAFAGLISPGLYQLNVVVPAAVVEGDNPISVGYAGLHSPAGDLLFVRR